MDGKKIYMDGSLVDANAFNNYVVKGPPELIKQLKKVYRKEEEKLDEYMRPHLGRPHYKPVNNGVMSTTDPDAAVVRHQNEGSRPRYKHHRVVDDAHGVITAVETTSGDVEENRKLTALIDQHEQNTRARVETVVADYQSGTADNFRKCYQREIRSHMGDLKAPQKGKGKRTGIFSEDEFKYDAKSDTYRCSAGQILKRRKHIKKREAYEYSAGVKICRECPMRSQCTRLAKSARTIKRHEFQEGIDAARAQSHSNEGKRDRVKRRWIMEGSFADVANNHGFKRARWRQLKNQRIQDYLIATIQNIRILINNIGCGPKAAGMEAIAYRNELRNLIASFLNRFFGFQKIYSFLWSCIQELTDSLFISVEYGFWATARQGLNLIAPIVLFKWSCQPCVCRAPKAISYQLLGKTAT